MWRADIGTMNKRAPTHVQADHLVPDITAPEKPVPDFDILVRECNTARILSGINSDTEILSEAECNSTVHPRLGAIALSAFLGAYE